MTSILGALHQCSRIDRCSQFVTRFARDESGVATIFALFMVMMMVLVGGIGADLMRAEMERTRLQATLDRAVLAAADLDQTLSPKEVVKDYFNKSGIEDVINDDVISVDQGLNYRIVTARGVTVTQSGFMSLMGVDELKVPAIGTAEERVSKVEVSLALDISGSMNYDSSHANKKKIELLQDAAKSFVRALLRPETQDLISISLIPYSEHVNISPEIYNQLNTYHKHNYSHCVEMPDAEFNRTALDTVMWYQQMQHYQFNYYGYNEVDRTVCPRAEWEQIVPLSQSVSDLEWHIDRYQPRAGTSIFMAVKWGAALLDPSTRGIISNLIGGNHVDGAFAGRPANYSTDDTPTEEYTLKTLVVMSDGKNDRSYRIQNWAYNSSSEYVHWANYNLWYYLNRYVRRDYHYRYYEQKYSASQGDNLTASICSAAKNSGIIIWGVGFEVDDHGASVLRACASSPSHFFRVEGVEISKAFSAIASQINQLRLTQ